MSLISSMCTCSHVRGKVHAVLSFHINFAIQLCQASLCTYVHVYTCTCMYLHVPACLPACLPAYLRICLPACLPVYLPTCASAYLPACLPTCTYLLADIPYSGYFSGGKIFVSSELWASSWKNFHGRGILNHTPVLAMWYCFVGKNFVARLSTTKTTKI